MSNIVPGRPGTLPWSDRLISKLENPDYRHSYFMEGVKTWIARQVRALRDQRGWSQSDLSIQTDKPQSAISRIEDPDYGKMSLQTLFDIAKAFDVALVVKFVDYPTFIRETNDERSASMYVASFDRDAFAIHSSSTNRINITLSNGRRDDNDFILLRDFNDPGMNSLTYFDVIAANRNWVQNDRVIGHG